MHITSLLFATGAAFFFSLIIILEKFHLLKFYKPHELVIFRRSIYPLFLIILLFCAPNTYKKLKTMNREIAFQTFLTVVFGGIVLSLVGILMAGFNKEIIKMFQLYN